MYLCMYAYMCMYMHTCVCVYACMHAACRKIVRGAPGRKCPAQAVVLMGCLWQSLEVAASYDLLKRCV